jgi:DNA-binding response OmpR family regulator
VVEDNELDSSQIVKVISDEAISVKIAPTGSEALELIKNEEYDCIILDYTLPDISGTDLIHEVSKTKKKLTPCYCILRKRFQQD